MTETEKTLVTKNKKPSVENLVGTIVEALEDKKGHDIVILDLRKISNAVSDFFVVAHGTSDTQVNALAGSVEEKVQKTLKDKPWHIEGKQNGEWVLLDYVNVVVHIFLNDKREFYQIEELWADAEIKRIEHTLN